MDNHLVCFYNVIVHRVEDLWKKNLKGTQSGRFSFSTCAKRLDIPKFRDENKMIEDIKNPRSPDLSKQYGIFVSVKEGKFMSPSEVITEQKCKEMRELVFNRHSSMK